MASTIDDVILDPLESVFDAVGAMQGPLAPAKRAAIGAGLGYGILMLKPSFACNPDGSYRPFILTAQTDADKQNATYFPWWAVVGVPAAMFSLLI
jgi:hypothetical protein